MSSAVDVNDHQMKNKQWNEQKIQKAILYCLNLGNDKNGHTEEKSR